MRALPLLIAVSVFAHAQTGTKLFPVDDSSRDSSFRKFVKKLQSAVDAHNVAALHKLTDKEVVVGPEKSDAGWQKFQERWHPEASDSEVWSALADMLSLGFVREHPRLFLSPYLVWRFPHGTDRTTHVVVIRDQAALRSEPSLKAPVVGTVSFEVVDELGPPVAGEGLGEWVRVRTGEGHTGYLNTRDVMSPMMPRGQFGMRDGKWLIIALEGAR